MGRANRQSACRLPDAHCFVNDQSHHRGQVATLLPQQGRERWLNRLLALIPNEAAACRAFLQHQ
ncbi:MAG: hypothetical protein EPN89_03160 [Methylovulum sp.]|nr:MAG: hypothetical protein EPN89_03160 [Methylovulum sp.]